MTTSEANRRFVLACARLCWLDAGAPPVRYRDSRSDREPLLVLSGCARRQRRTNERQLVL